MAESVMTESTDNKTAVLEDMFFNLPEPKLELVSGQLLAGNGLDGSRLLLWQLLRGWGAEAAVALGPVDVWIEALTEAYGLRPATTEEELNELAVQAEALPFQLPDLKRGHEGENAGHWQTCNHLRMALHLATREWGGHSLGRDFTLKLGEDGFTPDLFWFKDWGKSCLYSYYLDGPPELVIEITQPAHADYDRLLKRDLYALGGVPEYLIVNPAQRSAEFLRLTNGEYQPQALEADGCYRPVSLPGLAIKADHLWAPADFNWADPAPFIVEQPAAVKRERHAKRAGWEWGNLPFAPRLGLRPEPILFNEYISWCPEAKFEGMDDRIIVAGREATRNVLGLLLMSTGLYEAVQLLPAREWVVALQSHQRKAREDAALRQQWWQRAHEIAQMLRVKYGITRLGVAGDLLKPQPLDYWSELELTGWETPRQTAHNIYQDIVPYEDAIIPEINYADVNEHYFQARLKRTGATIQEIK